MMFPPSLPEDLHARAYHAFNGELGVRPDDVTSFLQICNQDDVEVLGWELWVVDHAMSAEMNEPVPAPGLWCVEFLCETNRSLRSWAALGTWKTL